MDKKDPLILVDGSSYLFRAFHAAPNFQTKKGEPTGTIYIVINMLKSLIKKHPSKNTVVIFDAKGDTFRNEIYKDYKANRPPMPDELRIQIEPIHQIIKAMGLPIVSVPSVEADDVIGTLSRAASAKGQKTIVSTGDKDMAQLVDENTTLLNTMKKGDDAYTDFNGVVDKFGVKPELIIDYLALMGDKVDNIPGVNGIGAKTAESLLREIGSINDIYANIDKVLDLKIRGSKSVHSKLMNDEENARMSYELATIKTDVQLSLSESDMETSEPNINELVKLFTTFEFNKWLDELNGGEVSEDVSEAISHEFILIDRVEELSLLSLQIEREKLFSVDFITKEGDRESRESEIQGIGITTKESSFYIEISKALTFEEFCSTLKSEFENKEVTVLGESIKFEDYVLRKNGVNATSIVSFDVESAMANAGKTKNTLDKVHPGEVPDPKLTLGTGKKKITVSEADASEIGKIPSTRSKLVYDFHINRMPFLNEHETKLLNEIDIPLIKVLSKMESNGVFIDKTLLKEIDNQIKDKQDNIAQEIYELAGEEFAISSNNNATREILHNKLQLPGKISKGKFSLAASELEKLDRQGYKIAGLIAAYNSLTKTRSTYSNKLHKLVNDSTGRLHTTYNQADVKTGRLSSKDPNLQGIPVRTEDGKKIRTAFCGEPGTKILAVDYSQIELRILAHLSKDPALVHAFVNGLDIHSATASELNGVSIEEVTSDMRRRAKAINFGLIYKQSDFGLAESLGISRKEAKSYMQQYFIKYSGAKAYLDSIEASVKETCEVKSAFGRVYKFPDAMSNSAMARNPAIRSAVNAPFQGTAADIIKVAMIKIDEWIESLNNQGIKMTMQVHDELIFEVDADFVEEAALKIKDIMENSTKLDVPLIADVGIGDNWLEAH